MSQPDGGSLIDLPRLFTDDNFRTLAVANVRDPIVKAFWQEQLAKTSDFHKSEMYNYFISKFGRFMTNDLMRNIIGQKKSSFHLRQLMDEGKILLVNLAKGKIGETNSNLLGLILVSKIQVAAFSRADITEEARQDFYLYVDEFQNFTTDTFATILAEARKYRLNLNITNQYFAQLTQPIRDAVIGNIGTLIAYRVGAEDAEYLAKELPGLSVEDLTNLDRFQAYVKLLIDLAPTKPFSLTGLKSPNVGSDEMANWLKQASRQRFSMKPVSFAPTMATSSPAIRN
jgi:type IV secretory pathway TraG/TraD family ATPase VirD4